MKYLVIFLFGLLVSCNYASFTPRSKRNIQKETPSILIFDKIVDFRNEQMGWPLSIADFKSKGIKYYHVFDDFPYNQTEFKIKDSNNMVFYFSEHKKDIENYKKTKKVDLNAYSGHVTFNRENGKFVWKLKMN